MYYLIDKKIMKKYLNHVRQSLMVVSQEPLASKFFEPNATCLTCWPWPSRVLNRLPVFVSQSLMVLTEDPLARVLLEANTTDQTPPWWPIRVLNRSPLCLFQSLIVLSKDATGKQIGIVKSDWQNIMTVTSKSSQQTTSVLVPDFDAFIPRPTG